MKTVSIRWPVLLGLLLAVSGGHVPAEGRSRKQLRAESKKICEVAQTGAPARLGARPRPPVLGPVGEVLGGHDQATRFERENPVRTDPRLERIGLQVAKHSDRPTMRFRFRALRKKGPLNAFSLLGGRIYVSEEFLKPGAFTDDELAALLGHEIAHAAFRDVPQDHLERWFLNYHAQALCDPPSDPRTVVGAVEALEERLGHDHHAQELAADQYGSLYAVRGGFQFSGGLTLIQKLAGLRDEQESFGNMPGAIGTHPSFAIRGEALLDSRQRLVQVALQFGEGNEALDDGRYDDAIEIFDSILGVFPESRNARLNLGSSLHGRYRYLKRVAEPAPELLIAPGIEASTIVKLLRGDAVREEPALLERAQLLYRAILDVEPDHPLARNNLAAAFFDSRDFDGAIAELELLTEREYVALVTYRNLGICYHEKSSSVDDAEASLYRDRAEEMLERFHQEVPGDRTVERLLEKIERSRNEELQARDQTFRPGL